MWRYLKYLVPLLILAISASYTIYSNQGNNIQLQSSAALVIELTSIFVASWFLYFTKPARKYAIFIILSLMLSLSPFLLVFFEKASSMEAMFWGKKVGLWYFSLGSSLATIFYMLRFYANPGQDIFSILKLLLVFLSTILLLINMLFVNNEAIINFSATIIFILLVLLSITHTCDMLVWEYKKDRNLSKLNSLDSLIDKISGNA